MVDVYREYLYINSVIYETMKEKLINVFVSFYGECYRGKITNIIENMLIILTGYGHDKKEIKSNIEKYKLEIKEYLINNYNFADNLSMNKYLSSAKFLVNEMLEEYANSRDGEEAHLNKLVVLYNYYLYYSFILNRSKKNTYMYMMSVPNDKYAEKFYKQFIYKREEEVVGSFYPNLEIPLITVHGPMPNLTTIIHEVNHSMHKEELLRIYKENSLEYLINAFGITGLDSRDDFIYEMINEYMAIYISSDYISKYGQPVMQDDQVDSAYYQLDNILGLSDEEPGPILNLYIQAKDIIDKKLIEGNGFVIKEILGNLTYDELNNKIKEIFFQTYNKFLEENRMITRDDIGMINLMALKELSNRAVDNSQEYRKYIDEINGYTDQLVSEGKVRKLKREN